MQRIHPQIRSASFSAGSRRSCCSRFLRFVVTTFWDWFRNAILNVSTAAAQLRFRRSLPESTISSYLTAGDIYRGLGCQSVPITECIIAIIEDDSSFRRTLERLVRASGFEAHGFASAEEFLGSATPGSHACLILDIHLPGMSGLDLLDHLIASCRPRPAVLITGRDQNDLRDRASCIPNSVYLPKPFLSTLLLHAVRSLVKRGD